MKNTGFENETNIREYLHKKYFYELNDNLKNNLILKLCRSIDLNTKIYCYREVGRIKPDIRVEINDNSYFISLKKGSGNSVHQEPIDKFTRYINNLDNCNGDIANSIKYYIWGDNTYDGTGPIADRVNATYLKKYHSDILTKIQNFFNLNKRILIDRFIKYGTKRESEYAQFIYYGTVSNGIIRPIDNVIEYLSKITKPILSVGGLTFQAWNRNINGGNKSEKKRGVIQVKWGNIDKELSNVPE